MGYENAIWIKPVVCTVEYIPSTKNGLRQVIFKRFVMTSCPKNVK